MRISGCCLCLVLQDQASPRWCVPGSSHACPRVLNPLLTEPRVSVLTPGSHPLEALARALALLAARDAAASVSMTAEFLRVLDDGTGRTDGLRKIVESLSPFGTVPLVLVVDQFEELYAAPTAPNERERFEAARDRFIATLIDATSDRGGRVFAVIAMRSDFLGATERHRELNAQISRRDVIVPFMSKRELEDSIRKPAEAADPPCEFPKSFVNRLVNDTLGQVGALPLLQFTLQQVWEALPQDPIDTLEALGGLGGAIAVKAEKVYSSLSSEDRRIARRSFLFMVHLGEGVPDTRRRAKLSDATSEKVSAEQVHAVLHRFDEPEARLVTLGQEPGGDVTFEVAHEALIRRWDRLSGWLDEGRDDQRFQLAALEDAELWEAGKGDVSRSFNLEQLKRFAVRKAGEMPALLSRYLDASLAAARAVMLRERRHRRAVWSWAIAATVSFLLAGVGSVYLTYELDHERHERRVALRLLVAQADRALRDKNYPLALELSLQAWDMGPTAS